MTKSVTKVTVKITSISLEDKKRKTKRGEVMLNPKFINELKESGVPLHRLAWESGLTPSQVYRITCGIERPEPGCRKVEALCRHLKMDPEEAFVTNRQEGHRDG